MKDTLARYVDIPDAARRDVYYDTQKLDQNKAVVDFFPPSADRNVSMANYISNPFPGEAARLVYGLSFELVKQYIESDAANNIDAPAIVNAVKDAGVIITADQDAKEFLRTGISDHYNFDDTHLDLDLALAGQAAAADQELSEAETVVTQGAAFYAVPDPFTIAPNQVISLSATFADASVFPTDADWSASNQSLLYLRAKLHVAEIEPAMQ